MEHCNARTKGGQNGRAPAQPGPWAGEGYCKRAAGWGVPETTTGRCKNHGGASLKGAGHPRATDLRSSRYVPKCLADDYEASLRRADQLSLDQQLAGIDAREGELWRRMDDGEAGPNLWEQAQRSFDTFERAVHAGNTGAAQDARVQLRNYMTAGVARESVWEGLLDIWELRRKLAATESTRRHQIEQNVTRSRLASLAIFMADGIKRAINENVSSEKEWRRALSQVATFVSGLALSPGREPINVHAEDV
jgi:hypothetical protein